MGYRYLWKETVDCSLLKQLYSAVGWASISGEQLRASFSSSWGWLTCELDGDIVAFVRVLSDGILHAYLCGFAVHPDHQSRGIGTEMMRRVLDLCGEQGLRPALKVREELLPFYERLGFRPEKGGVYALMR